MFGRWLRRNIGRVITEETKEMRRDVRALLSEAKKIHARTEVLRQQLFSCESKIEAVATRQEQNARKWNDSIARLDARAAVFEARAAVVEARAAVVEAEMESAKVLSGALAARQVRQLPPSASLRQAEFKVFSQFGEDGILQFLLAHVPITREVFVEFGVENYAEANTRFLLLNNHWQGLIMDGSESAMASVRSSPLAWRHHLDAVHAWVTADNVNQLIASKGFSGDIGLLSIDVDGMDYWIWKAIDTVQPRIVVCEYNALFGPVAEVTAPYRPDFSRSDAHFSWLFFGASLGALTRLGEIKGYQLAGVNAAGNNAFFVRRDVAGLLPPRRPSEVFQSSRFREARDEAQQLTHLNFSAAQALIGGCTVFDLQSDVEKPLAEVRGWPG